MSKAAKVLACAIACAGQLAIAGPTLSEEAFKATQAITLPNGQLIQSFDISWVDAKLGLYLLADRTNKAVDVIDTQNDNLVRQLTPGFAGAQGGNNDIAGPNGILTIGTQVWAGDGDSTVKVVDVTTGNLVVPPISTGGTKRADELCHDPKRGLVLIANDADSPPFVSFISTESYQVVGKIVMDGTHGAPNATAGIEQCQWNPHTQKFMINLPEVNGPGDDSAPGAVVVISPQHMRIERVLMVDHDKCAGPQGMAVGPEEQVLLGCNAPSGNGQFSTVVINDAATHIVAAFPNESGADEVWFNPSDNHYFLARSSAAGSQQLGVIDAKSLHEDASIVTNATGAGNAHSVAAEPAMNQVYVPIPATGTAHVCSSTGGTDASGCIAVMTTTNDDCGRGGPRDHDNDAKPDHCSKQAKR